MESATIGQCEQALKDKVSPEIRYVIFDFGKLEYISSMGVRLLLLYRKAMESRKGRILMCNLPPRIRTVVDMANVLPSSGIFDTLEDAEACYRELQG